MGGNFYVFFFLLKNVYGLQEIYLFQKCFQKIIELAFSRELWITDKIYLCNGKKLEFAGTLQDKQKVSSFKPKIR